MKIQLKSISKVALVLAALTWSVQLLNASSLWTAGANNEQSLFSDTRSAKVGDIITVIVSDTTSLSTSAGTTIARESAVNNSITTLLFANSGLGKHKGTLPATQAATERSTDSTSEMTNSQTVSGRMSVTIIDVLPNGNFVLEGRRLVSFSGESYYGILRGIIRPLDIGRNVAGDVDTRLQNMIYTQYIADAQVEYIPSGVTRDAQKPGWGTRILDKIFPF